VESLGVENDPPSSPLFARCRFPVTTSKLCSELIGLAMLEKLSAGAIFKALLSSDRSRVLSIRLLSMKTVIIRVTVTNNESTANIQMKLSKSK